MNRWKAAGTHLGLSILVIGGIALTAFLLWYPVGLYKVAGLDRLLLVMLGIDLTAGPLLTLILYRQGKKGLKFDLTVVALAQIAFLAYGLNTLRLSRPVFLVGLPDMFNLIYASEIDDEDLALAANPKWRRLSWSGPQLVGTRMPADPVARGRLVEEFMAGAAGIEREPKYYVPYPLIAPDLLRRAEPLGENAASEDEVRRAGLPRHRLRQAVLVSNRGEGILLLDSRTGMPLYTAYPPQGGLNSSAERKRTKK